MDLAPVTAIVSKIIYLALALIALWGAFCVIVVLRRVSQIRFRNEAAQDDFLDTVEANLEAEDFDTIIETCHEDPRAMPQLVLLAVANRNLSYPKIRALLADRFQRDVLSDLEYRLSWVSTVIKSAPMVGLFGTVMGMMGAFGKLASQAQDKISPTILADDISLALITTACGLAIAIPLVLCTASINVQIRKFEDLVSAGLTRFLEVFKATVSSKAKEERLETRG